MSEKKSDQKSQNISKEKTGLQFERRDIIKGLTAVPAVLLYACLLYTSPSPRDATLSRMPSSA